MKPKLADVRVELANVYYANGSDDEATEQDSIALALDVKNIEAQMVHGRLHARRREFDQAREAYHGVIVQDPKHAEAYSALAELFKSIALRTRQSSITGSTWNCSRRTQPPTSTCPGYTTTRARRNRPDCLRSPTPKTRWY